MLEGSHLTNRWDAAEPVALYHVANPAHGFFVEVSQDRAAGFTVLRSFHDPLLLEDYLTIMQLPGSFGY